MVAVGAGIAGLLAVAGVQANANGKLRKARDAIAAALAETETARGQTQSALEKSEESRQQAEAVSDFLVRAFRSPDPSQDGRSVKVVDVLDKASTRLEKDFAGSPTTRAALFDALGLTYGGLGLVKQAVGLHTKARAVCEAALGADHPETLKACNNLALAYNDAGRTAEAISLLEATLKRREAKFGPDDLRTLKYRNNLGMSYSNAGRLSEAIALHETTLKRMEAKLGRDEDETISTLGNLAIAYWRRATSRCPAAFPIGCRAERGQTGPGSPRNAPGPKQPGRSLPGSRPALRSNRDSSGDAQIA